MSTENGLGPGKAKKVFLNFYFLHLFAHDARINFAPNQEYYITCPDQFYFLSCITDIQTRGLGIVASHLILSEAEKGLKSFNF
jgi:hypothetical protein